MYNATECSVQKYRMPKCIKNVDRLFGLFFYRMCEVVVLQNLYLGIDVTKFTLE
jgi:hypothetical protein